MIYALRQHINALTGLLVLASVVLSFDLSQSAASHAAAPRSVPIGQDSVTGDAGFLVFFLTMSGVLVIGAIVTRAARQNRKR